MIGNLVNLFTSGNLVNLFTSLYADPCLKGFTQTIPPVEDWTQFNTLADVNGGSFLYPEFTCSGTLNSITIPYSIEGLTLRKWEYNLELTLTIWRKNVGGYHVQVGGDLLLKEQINTNHFGYLTEVVRKNATKQLNIKIQKHDILLLTGRNFTYYYDNNLRRSTRYRRHIPALLATYQPPGSETVTIPMIHVDFSRQSEQGDLRHIHSCVKVHQILHIVLPWVYYTQYPHHNEYVYSL